MIRSFRLNICDPSELPIKGLVASINIALLTELVIRKLLYFYKHCAPDGASDRKAQQPICGYKPGAIANELSSQFTVTVVPSANVVRSRR